MPNKSGTTTWRPSHGDRVTSSLRQMRPMGFHCYHDQPCPACGRPFVRYCEAAVCPGCGSDAAPVFALVDELLHYARLTLTAQGNLDLPGYQPVTEADRYLMLGFDLLEAFRRVGDVAPELVAEEAVDHYQLGVGGREAERTHWQRFFEALLSGWRAERHRPLDSPPAPAAADGIAPSQPIRPPAGQTFRKKWSPKA